MKKDAYYFSHDSNARHDEKILAMRSVYKCQGYGWYWVIIEMMRDANAYRLKCEGKYWHHAIAQELQTEPATALEFINDCVNEFGLFKTDGQFIWAESLLRRMEEREAKSELARQSANHRWHPKKKRTKSADANASKNDAIKEIKGKETKENEIKTTLLLNTPPSTPTHQNFCNRLLSPEGQLEREAIEQQTRNKLTPELLNDFLAHLTTGAKQHHNVSDFNSHLRNWLNTRPKAKPPDAVQVKRKII